MTSNNDSDIVTILNDLPEKVKSSVTHNSSNLKPNKGQVIVQKGDEVGGAFLLSSGRLRVYTLDYNGNEKPIYYLEEGEMCTFSINCIIHNVLYPAWVSVETDNTHIISISATKFRHLFENELTVRDYIVASLSKRIFQLMSAVEVVTTLDVGQRINSFLVRLCPESHILHISHQEIATQLGTAREVVSRHLKYLEASGHVVLSRMKIHIINPNELAALPPKDCM